MKIERLNENSIICTLTSFDLSVRNLNLRELAYGSEKAKKLFEEMMNKAHAEVGFDPEGTPIMIEAIPMGSDSIKLIISKVTDPEELDARFSRFTRSAAGGRRDAENWLNRLASALLEGAGDIKDLAGGIDGSAGAKPKGDISSKAASGKTDGKSGTGAAGTAEDGKSLEPAGYDAAEYRAFAFDDLDMVIRASKAAAAYEGQSILYRNTVGGSYILVIRSAGTKDDSFARCCNSIAEYGRMVRTVQNTLAYYDEHYKVAVSEDAVAKLASI